MITRSMYLALASIVAALMLVIVVGCGSSGSRSHDIETDSYGTVYGVYTDPDDGRDGVDTDTDIRVSWPDGDYPPPATFTFRLERDDGPRDWTVVYTELHSDAEHQTWTFEPTSNLAGGHWYKAAVTDDTGRRQVIFFRTYGSSTYESLSSTSTGAPPRGAAEHRVITRPVRP